MSIAADSRSGAGTITGVGVVVVALLSTALAAAASPADATNATNAAFAVDDDASEGTEGQSFPAPLGSGDARALLEAAAWSASAPHVGEVTVVSFAGATPRVATLDVQVDALGRVELRRPTRWLLGDAAGDTIMTTLGATVLPPATMVGGASLDVDLVLSHWDASAGPPRTLDTGPATPVRLVRRSGAGGQESIYIDHATGLAVRRETRASDGTVLRVVAYTSVATVEMTGPGKLDMAASRSSRDGPEQATTATPRVTGVGAAVESTASVGYDMPDELAGGFELLELVGDGHMTAARFGDGLSVISVYSQPGALNAESLDGATVSVIAERDVWTWPGAQPTAAVWTGADHTFTIVSDAPMEVVGHAIGSLPGDRVGHDVPSRIRRGLARLFGWLGGGA